MGIRITTLTESSVPMGMGYLLGEWGLSILIETDEIKVLFDTGKHIAVTHNADTLGIDLCRVDKIVLSHGHHDHTGGLQQVLRRMKKEIEIIAHPNIWAGKYTYRETQGYRYIGIPYQQEELEGLGAIFISATEPVKISDSIMTTGEVPLVTDFETIAPTLRVKQDSGWQPDMILDDQGIVISTEMGLIVILGCAHRGIINTLYHAQQLTGIKTIHTVLGGSHLINATDEQLECTIAALKELDIQQLGLGHCTGLPVMSRLSHEFGDRFLFNLVGTTVDLP